MCGTKPGITGFCAGFRWATRAIRPREGPIAALERFLSPIPSHLDGEPRVRSPTTCVSSCSSILAYVVALDRFWTFAALELVIILKTPWVMLPRVGTVRP